MLCLLTGAALRVHAQVGDGTGSLSSTSAFLTVGGEDTQLPAYADNALGFELGAMTQPRPLLGAQLRIGAYPFSARYVQMPMTAGYRVSRYSFFGFPYAPFAYIGGGLSRSQDKGMGYRQYPPHWQKCWEAQIGFDRPYHSFSWRVAEISFRHTTTPLHTLRSVGLSTGIVYRFHR